MQRPISHYIPFFLLWCIIWISPNKSLLAQTPDCFQLKIESIAAKPGDFICLPVTANQMNNVVSIQYGLNWDPAILEFSHIDHEALTDTSLYNEVTPGQLIVLWTSSTLEPVSFPDNTVLYKFCFKVVATAATQTDVTFSKQITAIEATAGAAITSQIPFNGFSGKVYVATPASSLNIDGCAESITCHNGGSGSIHILPSGGLPPYQATWTGPNGFSSTELDLNNLSDEGHYFLSLTDAQGNSRHAVFEILRYLNPFNISYDIVQPDCGNNTNGRIRIYSVTGGLYPYTYSWNTGATSTTISNLSAGIYLVTITDAGGCSHFESVVLKAPNTLNSLYDAQISLPTCTDLDGRIAINMAGDGSYGYNWNTGGQNASLENIGVGEYAVTITDLSNSCTLTRDFVLSDSSLNYYISKWVDCTPPLNATGPSIYVIDWSPSSMRNLKEFRWSNGQVDTSLIIDSLSNASIGSYSVIATDLVTGCQWYSGDIEVNCSVPEPCSPLFHASNHAKNDGSNSYIDMVIGVEDLSPNINGLLSLNWNPNHLAFESANLHEDGMAFANVELGTDQTQNGHLTFSLNSTDLGSAKDIDTLFLINFQVINSGLPTFVQFGDIPLKAELFDDDLNSINWAAKQGIVYKSINFDPGIRMDDICMVNPGCVNNDGSIELFYESPPPNGFNFFWSGPDGFFAEGLQVNGLAPGTYELLAQKDEDAFYRAVFHLFRQIPQVANVVIDPVGCHGETNGAISIYPIGGAGTPYTFDWNVNSLDGIEDPTNLAAGIYSLTLSDANGCSSEETYTLIEPAPLVISDAQLQCESGAGFDGSIDISVEGGVLFYNYQWSNGASSQDVYDLAADTYTVTVIDAANCQLESSFTLNQGILDATSDTTLCKPGELTLFFDAPQALAYSWTASPNLTCSTCPNPIATISASENFQLNMIGIDGCEDQQTISIVLNDCVWPGDTDTNGVVNHFDLLNIGLGYAATGPLRPNASINWLPQAGPDWSNFTPNSLVNYKHIDSDGSGQILDPDTLAIVQNWGEEHFFLGEDANRHLDLPLAVHHPPAFPFYVQPDTFYANASVALPVILGEMDQLAANIYGLAFSISYDPAVVVPGSASLTFSPSWLGNPSNMLTLQRDFHEEGRLDVAIVRTDGQNISGFGPIGILNITIEDDIFLLEDIENNRSEGDLETIFSIDNTLIINAMEEQIEVSPSPTTSLILENISAALAPEAEAEVRLYPNPADDRLYLETSNSRIEQVALLGITGEVISQWQPDHTNQVSLDLKAIAAGAYLLAIYTDRGQLLKTLTIIH